MAILFILYFSYELEVNKQEDTKLAPNIRTVSDWNIVQAVTVVEKGVTWQRSTLARDADW
jgi:hypothetical protein